MSGEIVGGTLPSTVPVQAAAQARAVEAPATTIRLSVGFITVYLSSAVRTASTIRQVDARPFGCLLFQIVFNLVGT